MNLKKMVLRDQTLLGPSNFEVFKARLRGEKNCMSAKTLLLQGQQANAQIDVVNR